MEFKVLFYNKPPKGITLHEYEKGYRIIINSINWEIFPLWALMVAIFLLSIILGFIKGWYGLWVSAIVFSYFGYVLTNVVFMKVEVMLIEKNFELFTFNNFMFKTAPYKIDLKQVEHIRTTTFSSTTGSSRNSLSGSNSIIEMKKNNGAKKEEISLFTLEYNVFISKFLKEYIKLLK